jgi:hypothetical protein
MGSEDRNIDKDKFTPVTKVSIGQEIINFNSKN